MAGEPDGTLFDWRDIATSYKWDTLLLGNGMSINIWEPFGYRKLYDRAKLGGLSAQDRKLFSSTPNFERVLADLLTAIRVSDAVGLETKLLLERYRNIQRALVQAIREVHIKLGRVPPATRKTISDTMERFEWVFTTSYDLLVYWAIAAGGFEPFMDHFRYRGRCEFDPARASVPANKVPVYFLHGALHLVVGGSGATWKLRQTDLDSILNRFGKPIKGDARARPLLVTEGSKSSWRSRSTSQAASRRIRCSSSMRPRTRWAIRRWRLRRILAALRREPLPRPRNPACVDDLAGAIQDPNFPSAFLAGQLPRSLDRIGLGGAVRGRTPMALLDHVPASPAGGLLHVARGSHPGLLVAISPCGHLPALTLR